MTLRMQKSFEGHSTTIRLSGRLAASHRPSLTEQIEDSTGMMVLDLEEVTLVDLDMVQFLARCEERGMQLRHCSPYIREWISRETLKAKRSVGRTRTHPRGLRKRRGDDEAC